ncbi:hypothetical protein SO802_004723 [Lithocarpus litseifolius]|uniref:Alpha-aminoacylpeptide hydrolase n=1 Tax=Lithocarpus litseifolius TaxID=425828 RepID=A0AAW2E5R7_9ROSI
MGQSSSRPSDWEREQENERRRREEEENARRRREEEDARRKREEEDARRKKQEEDARKKREEEDARRKREEEEDARRKREEEDARRKKQEEDARKKREEEDARRKREEEEDARRKREEEDARRKKQEEDARKKREEEDARRKREEEEDARRKKQEEDARKKREEEDARRKREEEDARRKKQEEDARKKREEEDARRKREEEDARRKKQEEDAKRKKEEEDAKKKKEEEDAKAKFESHKKMMEQLKGQSRLPKFAVPKRYDIWLKPNLSTCKFAGSVAIELNIVADTSFIILNVAELSIDTASLSFTHHPATTNFSNSNQVLKPLYVDVVEEDEILVLDFVDTLPIGIGLLTIAFKGTLNDKMKGFYIRYNTRAMFKITLDVPSQLVALSNMPIIEEKVDGDLKTVSYQESPIMSTYLVAIVVGLFDYVEHLTSDGIKVRVYCQVGKVNQGNFALDVAVRTLELYKEYFAVPYFLPKLDMVAIPDFAFGAMENYGLVTCCETNLIYDNQHSAAANKQRVVIAVAHELAHQWFGNLVTMEWWTHLWLNEGFATWVSYLAANHLFPEWEVWTQKLGWEPKKGESHLDAMLRGEVWTALAVFGYDPTLKEASRRFHAFLDDRNTPLLHPDIRKAAYVAVMRRVSSSNRFGFESLLRVYRETDLNQEKTRILSSLTSSPDPSIILEALNFLLSSEVRTQDAVLGLAVSREGRETAWAWLKDNWEHISKTWGSGYLITHFVNSIVSPFASFEKANEIEEFFANQKRREEKRRESDKSKSMEQFKGQSRLPKFAVPKRYDIRLKPDLAACNFAGSVAIHLHIVADTTFIVLNAADLSVHSASLSFDSSSSKVLEPSKIELVEADEILVLEFPHTLPLGIGVLNIAFQGTLNDKMKGFYRSTYEHNALSNMPIIEEKVDGHLKTVSYQESPIMSTYLVAVVVGLFDYVEDHTSDGIKVRVYCQVGMADQGKFALDVAVKTLGLYTEYFAVPYSLPKLDMIAIPDFAAGAMENYGLVTYRETALLYDEQHSAAANKQRVATVVAHELAHQWFGNLVTMEWWTHLWLNEGFATWVSYLATDSLFPEWKIWTQFLDESTEEIIRKHIYLISGDITPARVATRKLGWDPKTGESHLDAMLRGEVLNALALFGHDLTLNEASRRFHAFLDDKNTPLLPPDTRKAAYVAVMRRVSASNKLAFESLQRLYKETDLSQEKTRILSNIISLFKMLSIRFSLRN